MMPAKYIHRIHIQNWDALSFQREMRDAFWPHLKEMTYDEREYTEYWPHVQSELSVVCGLGKEASYARTTMKILPHLRAYHEQTKDEIIRIARKDLGDTLQLDQDTEQTNLTLYFESALRIWLNLKIRLSGHPEHLKYEDVRWQTSKARTTKQITRAIEWKENISLDELVAAMLPKRKVSPGKRWVPIKPAFNTANLVRDCDVRIRSTNYLNQHLKFDKEIRTVFVYAHDICLSNHLESDDESVIPRNLLQEALHTLNLLFPVPQQEDQKLRLGSYGPVVHEGKLQLDIANYEYYGDMLLELIKIYNDPLRGLKQGLRSCGQLLKSFYLVPVERPHLLAETAKRWLYVGMFSLLHLLVLVVRMTTRLLQLMMVAGQNSTAFISAGMFIVRLRTMGALRSPLVIYDKFMMMLRRAIRKAPPRRSTVFVSSPDGFETWGTQRWLKFDDNKQWALSLGEAIGKLDISTLHNESQLTASETRQQFISTMANIYAGHGLPTLALPSSFFDIDIRFASLSGVLSGNDLILVFIAYSACILRESSIQTPPNEASSKALYKIVKKHMKTIPLFSLADADPEVIWEFLSQQTPQNLDPAHLRDLLKQICQPFTILTVPADGSDAAGDSAEQKRLTLESTIFSPLQEGPFYCPTLPSCETGRLIDILDEIEPHIVFFAGGNTSDKVIRTDCSLQFSMGADRILTSLLSHRPNLKLVILAGCFKESQAQDLADAAGCVVGWENLPGEDDASRIFEKEFLKEVLGYRSFQGAYGKAMFAVNPERIKCGRSSWRKAYHLTARQTP
jgi:hypothetical protein